MTDLEEISQTVIEAVRNESPLNLTGAGTKKFLGYPAAEDAVPLQLAGYSGVVDYHPEELVVRARCGTPVSELTTLLDNENQMLGFEPPDYDGGATLGGTLGAGISGSRRPYAGSVKDYVLGVGMILHDGSSASFGGQVMKNVAGYDVSRLVCGAFGTLGVVHEVSLKVLPKPERESTLALEISVAEAHDRVQQLTRRVSSLSASCYMQGTLYLRFSGTENAVARDVAATGGDRTSLVWAALHTQSLPQFQAATEVWRLSTSPEEPLDAACQVFDWGFAQRWLLDPGSDPRAGYTGSGHWTRFRTADPRSGASIFQPLPPALLAVQARIKETFDPAGVFNPGRVYQAL